MDRGQVKPEIDKAIHEIFDIYKKRNFMHAFTLESISDIFEIGNEVFMKYHSEEYEKLALRPKSEAPDLFDDEPFSFDRSFKIYEQLKDIAGLIKPKILAKHKHVYYLVAFKYDEKKIGIPRDLFIDALNEEGIPTGAGYLAPLYLTPIYHENKPFIYNYFGENINYDKGICPITERLYEKELITFQFVRAPATKEDMDDVVRSIRKIINNKEELLKEKLK